MTKPVKTRSEGQWALGDTDPLNPNEEFKKEDPALNVRTRVDEIYSKRGFDSIDKTDLRGRMRWLGSRAPSARGYDGTFTGEENTDLIEAPYFMLRVRSDGGLLTAASLRVPRRDLHRVRPRHRGHLRPAERPVPLDPDRGHAGDLAATGQRRAADHRGVRRLPARGVGLAAGR